MNGHQGAGGQKVSVGGEQAVQTGGDWEGSMQLIASISAPASA